MLPKKERLKIFLERLDSAKAVGSADEALLLLRKTLNGVEDEFSGVIYDPELWKSDGRMYAPNEDNRRKADGPFRRYRSRMHNTLVGENGSLKIIALDGSVLLDKAGDDGRRTDDLRA